MSLVLNQQQIYLSPIISYVNSRRRTSSFCKPQNLNKSYYNIQTPSNDSSISSCDSSNTTSHAISAPSYIESDLLETNIKEIEYTLLGLMDSEAVAAANRNSQRLASISNGKLDILFKPL